MKLSQARGAAPILLLALGLGLALLLCLLPAVQPQPTLTHTPDTQRLLRTHNTHTVPSLWQIRDTEVPYKPSPRSGYSSRTSAQLELWEKYQQQLRKNMATVGHVNVLFLGDSITESLIGTSYGGPCHPVKAPRCKNVPEVCGRWVLICGSCAMSVIDE